MFNKFANKRHVSSWYLGNIYEHLVFMKSGKNYGQFGHYSDDIINGTLKLNVYNFVAVY